MFPTTAGTATAAKCPASPQFASFAPPGAYPPQPENNGNQLVAAAAVHNAPGSMSMRNAKTSNVLAAQRAIGAGPQIHTLGHHRGDLIFPDDMDSIEFCIPPPSSAAPQNGGLGLNGELMLLHGSHQGEAYTERRRRGHSRRSNHKMDVEQQVKWSRKNIAATMERFEPTPHSSSSTSSLDYGFAAGVMTPSSSTPSHQNAAGSASMSSALSLHLAYNSGGSANAVAPFNHVYSYAYYEPGAAKCHTNVPHKDDADVAAEAVGSGQSNGAPIVGGSSGYSKSPPRNSIRALLAKSFRSKSSHMGQAMSSSPITEERDRHTYTTRYGTTENLYEEVNEQKIRKVLSDNRISASSLGNVKDELRRVQHNHFRVLDELNLSLEALIMPPTPPDTSPNHGGGIGADEDGGPTTSSAAPAKSSSGPGAPAQRPRRGGLLGGAASASSTVEQQRALSHVSLENLSTTLNSMELKDHAHSSCINPEFDEGDLDSGFSGSGSSSGASYNESLRYYKTGTSANQSLSHSHQQIQNHQATQLNLNLNQHNHHSQSSSNHNHNHNSLSNNINHMHMSTLPHNLRSCRSSTASATSTSKSSMASCGEDQGIAGMGSGLVGIAHGGCTSAMDAGTASLSPFNYPRRCSADTQHRASARSIATSVAASTATGAKPKKNFWNIKP